MEKQKDKTGETGYDNEISTVTPQDADRAERERNEQLQREAEQQADNDAVASNYNAHQDGPLDRDAAHPGQDGATRK